MKTALLLSLACAAAVVSGCCCAHRGGTVDTYNTQTGTVHSSNTYTTTLHVENTYNTGSVHQTEPATTDPSIAPGPYDVGPQIPP
jgi:hypothetical protein